jgi:hypothetical protein
MNLFPDNHGHHQPLIQDGHVLEPCETIEEERLYSGKYLELRKYHFIDARGKERSAEGVHMVKNDALPSTPMANDEQRVKKGDLCTIAVLRKQIMCDSLVLVKQYRAPLKAYTIEFPATVLDNTATPTKLAAKEIADDTGYSSVVVKYISPLTSLEPDISDGKLQFVSLNIDGDDPMQHPHCQNNNQSVGGNYGAHGDIVEVIQVPIDGLLDRLEQYDRRGIIVDSRVVAFAIGLEKGAKLLRPETVVETEQPM